MAPKILIVDDEESIRFSFEVFLSDEGYAVTTADSYDQASCIIRKDDFDLIFIDIILEANTGIDLLRAVKERNPSSQVIIITGAPSIETASDALRLGALDYLVKPVRRHMLLRATDMALRHKALSDEKERYRLNLEAIFRSVRDGIITVDREMTVVEVNEAATGLCGIHRSRAIGRPLQDVTGNCSARCLAVLHKTLTARSSAEGSRVECQAPGKPLQVISVSASPLLDRRDKFSGGVMVLRDETRLLDLERSLRQHKEFDKIIGTSEEIRKVQALIKYLADVPTTVLITGESGTGKELLVEALHKSGDRSDKPLVKVNCAALADNLLESELFGHVQGAFTGAFKDKIGRFQRGDKGIVFLDEIGDISPKMQLRLLRVIETMEFERVGDSTPIRVDVRVVAATNQDLREKIARGEFREDLFYRLKVMEVELPPLRNRQGDIPLLVNHFIEKFNRKFGKRVKALSADVQELFMNCRWPGNVRELENTLEHAFILCQEDTITRRHLPRDFDRHHTATPPASGANGDDELQTLLRALDKTAGNKSKAARLLGMSRKTIYRKLDKYNRCSPPDGG